MIFHQYYLDCLSHASYLIGDETSGRAVVVDPQRDISEYLKDAEDAGLTIELVLETHFHADFLSGHLELAEATGAAIGFSSVAEPEYPIQKLADGERLELGDVVLEFRHTPGHTPESMSIVLYEHADDDVPYGVLTGDTLFIGDVGRPDLLTSIGFSRDELATKLYDSLHTKLLTLPDSTQVFPAHGAGSACGKNLSADLSSTIGVQRRENYALLAPDQQTFIDLVTEGQPPAPGYFIHDATLNKQHHALLDEDTPPPLLSWHEVRAAVDQGAMIIDGRDPMEFAHGHLRGAVNVGLEGRYAEFAGSIIDFDTDVVLFVDPGYELEAKNRLGRVGFDRVVGAVADPYEVLQTYQDQAQVASRLTPVGYDERARTLDDLQLVDVRNPGEFALGTIPGAVSIPVGQLPTRLDELDPARPTVVFCAGGYRSSVAASLLRAEGFTDVSDITGGYSAWAQPTATRAVMDAHDWDRRYDQAELIWSAGPNTFVVDQIADLPPGRALDVACGEGRNALWLADRGWDVVGVDFSEVGIDKARRIAAHRGVELDWRVGDVTDPDVVEGEFDLVLVAYLHLPADQLTELLGQFARRVAPGGRLLVIGHHADNLEHGYGGPPDRAVLHDPDRIGAALAATGLEVVACDEVHREVATDDGDRTAIDSLVLAGRAA